jgi:hypothetical protein
MVIKRSIPLRFSYVFCVPRFTSSFLFGKLYNLPIWGTGEEVWFPDLSPVDGLRLALSPMLSFLLFVIAGVNKVSSVNVIV